MVDSRIERMTMTEQTNTILTFGLFALNDELSARDPEQPDFELHVVIDEEVMESLSQLPSEEESISVAIERYSLDRQESHAVTYDETEVDVQLILNHGPVLSAVVDLGDERIYVSPLMELIADDEE